MTLTHHINQAIKAHGIMQRDVDYVVKDGEVIIVDEFTGRLMIGRRYNEGLHQAIEAKEGVKVDRREQDAGHHHVPELLPHVQEAGRYDRYGQDRGPASSREIYGLDVVDHSHQPAPSSARITRTPCYKTVNGKYNAVIEQIDGVPQASASRCWWAPCRVEKMRDCWPRCCSATPGHHSDVLNAKYHEKEAEIVAQAGKSAPSPSPPTWQAVVPTSCWAATPEFMAKAADAQAALLWHLLSPEKPEVVDPSAVELLLTESDGHGETTDENVLAARKRFAGAVRSVQARHRGRGRRGASRQAACSSSAPSATSAAGSITSCAAVPAVRATPVLPGSTCRLEDDLMRLFGGDRVAALDGYPASIDEDTPIENRMLTNTLESAQKKAGGHATLSIRKNVLKYDDVMNQQREIIYGQRHKVLDGEDISAEMHKMLRENIDSSCAQFLAGDVKDEWDFGALRRHYQGWLTTDADFHYTVEDYDSLSREGIADLLYDRGMDVLNDKEQRYGAPLMRELERICLLKCVDRQWMDHIDNMDQLRQGIALRGYGQKDPVVEYRIEGFDMFDQMVDSIRESSIKMLLTIEVRKAGAAPKREQVAKPTGEGFVPGNGAPGAKGAPKGQPVRVIKIGRNDPCPCGSGLKWKKCTCAQYHPDGAGNTQE